MGYANSYKGFGDLSEKEYKSKIITDLKRDFVVKEEYWGTHFSGQKVRIDAVFRPKNTDLWMRDFSCRGKENYSKYLLILYLDIEFIIFILNIN